MTTNDLPGSTSSVASKVPKATAYGGVVFDAEGRTLLREPLNHFGGYVWTFSKGRPDPGESPEQTALREMLEETGYRCRITGVIPKVFAGITSTTAFFLMAPIGDQGPTLHETVQTRWVDIDEAGRLIRMTKVAEGVTRDLAVLDAAVAACAALSA